VILIDGFYIAQMRPNGAYHTDAKGRRRAVEGRFKRWLLVALGIWPDTGRQEVLAWLPGLMASLALSQSLISSATAAAWSLLPKHEMIT
jgi:hypothetical protein